VQTHKDTYRGGKHEVILGPSSLACS